MATEENGYVQPVIDVPALSRLLDGEHAAVRDKVRAALVEHVGLLDEADEHGAQSLAACAAKAPAWLGGSRRFYGFWCGYLKTKPSRLTVEHDTRTWQGTAWNVVVANAQFSDGGLRDDLKDVHLVRLQCREHQRVDGEDLQFGALRAGEIVRDGELRPRVRPEEGEHPGEQQVKFPVEITHGNGSSFGRARFGHVISRPLHSSPDRRDVDPRRIQFHERLFRGEEYIYGFHAGHFCDGMLNMLGALAAVHAGSGDFESLYISRLLLLGSCISSAFVNPTSNIGDKIVRQEQ